MGWRRILSGSTPWHSETEKVVVADCAALHSIFLSLSSVFLLFSEGVFDTFQLGLHL